MGQRTMSAVSRRKVARKTAEGDEKARVDESRIRPESAAERINVKADGA